MATASADLVIESKIESAQLNSTTTIKVKGGKMRVDIPDGPIGAMSSIIDTTTGSIQIAGSRAKDGDEDEFRRSSSRRSMPTSPPATPKAPMPRL